MKGTFNRSLKRTIAFVSALVILSSAIVMTAFANQTEGVQGTETLQKYADDYTKLFPGLRDTKLKLSDPKFSDKEWYEYIEYEFYSEVTDGDITYRINKPVDIGQASIMAIGDYKPSDGVGNTARIAMDLGELQGILDMAAQGSNISKEFAGLSLASGIASNMTNIGKVMDNSKYYSHSSFLGIPGDDKFTGVSNNGFYNADSLEIEISKTEAISAGKTIALDSEYSVTESDVSSKDFSTFHESSEAKSNTREETESQEHSHTAGVALSDSTSNSQEISDSVSNTLGREITNSTVNSLEASIGSELGTEGGVSGIVAKITANVTTGMEIGYTVGESSSMTHETGRTQASSREHSDTHSEEDTDTRGQAISNSETFEKAMTNGDSQSETKEHAKDMSVKIGYGAEYQYTNETSITESVTRVFNAREDDAVKNVGWKLCEYIVKVPYYIEAVRTEADGTETVLYGQYVNYNLLNGVCRVFANGYIEHWYNGSLVTYADFFDGFVTASELVDKAKAQQAEKGKKEG